MASCIRLFSVNYTVMLKSREYELMVLKSWDSSDDGGNKGIQGAFIR